MNIYKQPNSKLGSDDVHANTIEGEIYWQEHIERCSKSGLNKAKYARKHGLNYARFLYWHKRNTDSQTQNKSNKLLPIKVKPVERTDKLCSINIGGCELQIYDLLILDHLLDRLN